MAAEEERGLLRLLPATYRTFPFDTISVRNESPSSRRHFISFGVRTIRSIGNGAVRAMRILTAWLCWFHAGMTTRMSPSLSSCGVP